MHTCVQLLQSDGAVQEAAAAWEKYSNASARSALVQDFSAIYVTTSVFTRLLCDQCWSNCILMTDILLRIAIRSSLPAAWKKV